MSGSLYLYSSDVDAAWSELKEKAAVCYEIETFDYGMREFAVYDNNGYIVQFGQPVQQADTRVSLRTKDGLRSAWLT